MISRRVFACGIALATQSIRAGAAAAPTKAEANRSRPYRSHQETCLPTNDEPWPLAATGPSCSSADLRLAAQFLSTAPASTSPIEVARAIANSIDKGQSGELFRRRWKTTSNPVIPWYFAFTDEAPCNDAQLDWCAAFASWVLVRSGRERLPFADVVGNIAALKKRAYSNPLEGKGGDLVFLTRKGGGHVGFLSRWEGKDSVRLVGGNQREPGFGSAVAEQLISVGEGSAFRLGWVIPIDSFAKVDREPPVPQVRATATHLLATRAAREWPTAR